MIAAAAVAAVVPWLGVAGTASALTGPPEPTSYAQGNLVSLDHSDFENASNLGAAVSTNAALSQGTGTTMLHTSALKDTVPATGTTAFKLATGNEITVVPGAQYRVGAFVHPPAVTGDTLQWSFGGYSASGVWQGWTNGPVQTLANTPNWQYVSTVLTIPASVTNVIGVKATFTGTQAGDVIRMDEFTVSSNRSAVAVGAVGNHCNDGTCNNYTASDFLADNQTTDPGIGPLQTTKEFFQPGDGLPVFSNTVCSRIEAQITNHAQWPVCMVAYKDQVSQATMTAFMQSVPADQQVILIYHQEPEGDYASGSTFVSEWNAQYSKYQAAGDFENISMDMDSASYPYKSGAAQGCSYIVPGANTDGYLFDYYESTVDGNNVSQNSNRGVGWVNWLNCVKVNGKPLGIAEQGYDQGTTSSVNNTPTAERADQTYLSALPDSIGLPFLYRDYWNTNVGGAGGNWQFTTAAERSEWRAEEAANGGY
jgi:hypothetical protein